MCNNFSFGENNMNSLFLENYQYIVEDMSLCKTF